MRLDDRFALRDGIEDLGDTVRDVVAYDVADEEGSQRDTDDRRDEVPPGMSAGDETGLHEPLDEVDEGFEQRGCGCAESTYEEGQQEHQVLLADMAFTPFDDSIVIIASQFTLAISC